MGIIIVKGVYTHSSITTEHSLRGRDGILRTFICLPWPLAQYQSLIKKVESESRSVMSDSLQSHGLYSIYSILQARILEWIAFPFSRGSSQPRDRTQVSGMAGGFFTS